MFSILIAGGFVKVRSARAIVQSLSTLGIVALMTVGLVPASNAQAAATPDSGISAGGTVVTGTVSPVVHLSQPSAGSQWVVTMGDDGNVYAWGRQDNGAFNPASKQWQRPTLMTNASDKGFTRVIAGSTTAYGLSTSGEVFAWGSNSYGQIGDGTVGTSTSTVPDPVKVQLPDGVIVDVISASGQNVLVIGSDGITYAWGTNSNGQIGDGAVGGNRPLPTPVQMPTGVTFTSVVSGGTSSYGLGSDGRVYAWGLNASGQLGDGTTTNRSVPVEVKLPLDKTYVEIAASPLVGGFARADDGSVYAWGANDKGQLGIGTTSNRQATPHRFLFPRESRSLSSRTALPPASEQSPPKVTFTLGATTPGGRSVTEPQRPDSLRRRFLCLSE
ncbi:hypothetical protein G7067_02535 [Leucobacter insecticola]|uniref:RCC1-like domain-containing protein n=1 Tax=Leucobacter insecticola TaxID=2714934 RepID=A0A6G8FHM9_9MICO|nr:hypothetical protein [Leucobacter insecticola]QIM15542.1 hypothetical protein G7067_02535 [Leucobacter insecticola]